MCKTAVLSMMFLDIFTHKKIAQCEPETKKQLTSTPPHQPVANTDKQIRLYFECLQAVKDLPLPEITDAVGKEVSMQ